MLKAFFTFASSYNGINTPLQALFRNDFEDPTELFLGKEKVEFFPRQAYDPQHPPPGRRGRKSKHEAKSCPRPSRLSQAKSPLPTM